MQQMYGRKKVKNSKRIGNYMLLLFCHFLMFWKWLDYFWNLPLRQCLQNFNFRPAQHRKLWFLTLCGTSTRHCVSSLLSYYENLSIGKTFNRRQKLYKYLSNAAGLDGGWLGMFCEYKLQPSFRISSLSLISKTLNLLTKCCW